MATLNLDGVKPIKVQQIDTEELNLIYERVTWKDNEAPALDASNLNKSEQMLYDLCAAGINYRSIDGKEVEQSSDNLIQGLVKIINEEVNSRSKDTTNINKWATDNFRTLNDFVVKKSDELTSSINANKSDTEEKFTAVNAQLTEHTGKLKTQADSIKKNTDDITTNADGIKNINKKLTELDLSEVVFKNNTTKSTLDLVTSIKQTDGKVSVSKAEFSLEEVHLPNVSSNKIYFDTTTSTTLTTKIKDLQEDLDKVSSAQKTDASNITGLQQSIEGASAASQQRDTALQQQVDIVKQTADNAATKEALEQTTKSFNDHISAATTKNNTQDTNINNNTEAIRTVKDSISNIEQDIKELQETVDTLEGASDVSDLSVRVSTIEGNVSNVQQTVTSQNEAISTVAATANNAAATANNALRIVNNAATKDELNSLGQSISSEYATKGELQDTDTTATAALEAAQDALAKYDSLQSDKLLYDFDEIIFTCGDSKTCLFT